MKHRLMLLLAVATVLGACAGGRGTALYQKDVGTASMIDALDRANLVVTRHHYEVSELDSIPIIRIETHWRQRPLFADEQALGITNAESRLIITARSRSETEVATLYNVRLIVENRVRVAGATEWNDRYSTPQFVAYADGITADFRRELQNIGVRRF
jgi:hypothetical protein